jgi:hypothetical protein
MRGLRPVMRAVNHGAPPAARPAAPCGPCEDRAVLRTIVEGEPGVFPEPVARIMRGIGGLFRRKPAEDRDADPTSSATTDDPGAFDPSTLDPSRPDRDAD